jgi:hypothetical protein
MHCGELNPWTIGGITRAMHACTICWSKSEAHIMQLHIMQRSLTSSFSRSPEGGLINLTLAVT